MIRLEPLSGNHISDLAINADNIKIWNNVKDIFPHPYTKSDAENFVEKFGNSDKDHVFAILDKDQFTGVIGIHQLDDIYKFTGELGYWIGEPYWGRGLATKAIELVLPVIWDTTKIMRIEAGVFDYNHSSMRVLEKNGFIKEAVRKKRIIKNDTICDEHLYYLTRPDN